MRYYPHKNLQDVMVVVLEDDELARGRKFKLLEKYCYTRYSYDTYVAFELDTNKWNKFIATKSGFSWLLASPVKQAPNLLI